MFAVHKTHLHGPTDTDESTDTYDTIDWLVKNVPDNNGRVGMWGISYPGFYAAYGLINSHPALKAVSPQAPMGDVGNGDDAYHNGAFYLAANFGFYSSFKPRGVEPERPPPNRSIRLRHAGPIRLLSAHGSALERERKISQEPEQLLERLLDHDTYDEFWQSRAQAPHMNNVDAGRDVRWRLVRCRRSGGSAETVPRSESGRPKAPAHAGHGPVAARRMVARRMATTLGNLNFASKTGEFFREQIELPFFVQNLKDKGDGLKASARCQGSRRRGCFETGTNHWRALRHLAAQRSRRNDTAIWTPAANSHVQAPSARGISTNMSAIPTSRSP